MAEEKTQRYPAGPRPGFGDKVKVTARLKRKSEWANGKLTKYWVREPYTQEGVFIGVRDLKNGGVTEEGNFKMHCHFRVALVALDLHLNPVYVPFDAVEVVAS